jgi:hypothetical protein
MAMDALLGVVALGSGICVLNMAPRIHRNILINATPIMSGFFRPKRSTPKTMKMLVVMILTIPYIPDAKSPVLVPVIPIDWKIVGA